MRQIVPDHLGIGNAIDVWDALYLLVASIEPVVVVAYEVPLVVLTRDIVHCRFPSIDESGNRPIARCRDRKSCEPIRRHVSRPVRCVTGMSRSPEIVTVALGIVRNDSPDNCVRELITRNPHEVSPHAAE